MHNLRTVVKFEILKQIRKPLFWVAVFAFPLMMIVFGGLSYLSGSIAEKQSEVAKDELKTTLTSLLVVDNSGLVDQQSFQGLSVKSMTDSSQALEFFKKDSDPRQALIIYPAHTKEEPIRTYTKLTDDASMTQQVSMGVSSIAKAALVAGASTGVSHEVVNILSSQNLSVQSQIIDNKGEAYNPFQKMIVPGVFLVVFFIVFMLTGNQILVATTEEKENRVAEMILTTVNAKALIIGKIIAMVTLGFIQIIALLTPIILLYLAGTKFFSLPPLVSDLLNGATIEFWPIFFGASLLIFGFLMVTGATILVGALFPTAQDAAQFYAPIILSMMLPFYLAGAIFTGAKTVLVQILSFFPLSAPITLLMRNTAGNLSVSEGLIGLAIVVVSSVIVMLLAVRVFRRGVFEYSKPASLKEMFKR